MVKRIIISVLILSIIIGADVLAVHYYSRYLVGFEKIYVASHNLSQRKIIGEEDITEIEVPKGFLNKEVVKTKEEIIGKYVRLAYSIPSGSLFYKHAIEDSPRDINHTLLYTGQVSYDIFTSEAKVNSGSLSRNMYVDLYLTVNKNSKPISDLLLSNARIIGMYDMNEQAIADYDKNSRVYIITLAVDKEDVNYLNMAFALGEIKIVASSESYITGAKSVLNSESAIFEYLK